MYSRKAVIKNTRAAKRKEHKRTLMRRLTISLVLLFVFVGALAWASGYERFVIASVRVEGANLVDADAVAIRASDAMVGRYGYLFSKRNIWLYPRTDIISAVTTSSQRIASARVRTEGSDLVVTIDERKPASVWCPPLGDTVSAPRATTNDSSDAVDSVASPSSGTAAGCYFADRDGMIYGDAPSFSGPIFFTWYAPLLDSTASPEGNRFLSDADFTAATAFLSDLKKIGLKPETGTIVNDEVRIRLSNGEDVLCNRGQAPDELIANFTTAQSALPEGTSLEYMDLRFGTKVFYKEKEETRVMSVSQ